MSPNAKKIFDSNDFMLSARMQMSFALNQEMADELEMPLEELQEAAAELVSDGKAIQRTVYSIRKI